MNREFLNVIASTVLEFTHEPIIVPLLVIGYIWIGRKIFSDAICLLFLSMIFNAALKSVFQIPLAPSVGKGFAFPSGHMQTAVVFYGYLYAALNIRVVQRAIIILLFMIGASLIHAGYHNIIDVIGAVFFGILLISGYQYFKRLLTQEYLCLILFSFASACLLFLYMAHFVPAHLWMAYYALLGFLSTAYFLESALPKKEQTFYQKLITTLICSTLLFAINFIFSLKIDIILALAPLRWFSLGVAMPLSLFLSGRVFLKKRVGFKRIK